MTGSGHNAVPKKGSPQRDGMRDIARRLDDLLRTMADLPSPPPASSTIGFGGLDAARHLWRLERQREETFGLSVLANPAWDILLDLFIAREEGREVTVETLACATRVPELALIRCIASVMEGGLVVRQESSSSDRSATFLLSHRGLQLMRDYLNLVEAGGDPADA